MKLSEDGFGAILVRLADAHKQQQEALKTFQQAEATAAICLRAIDRHIQAIQPGSHLR